MPYRNYIYSNNINDFYIADTAPNFIAVFLFIFFKKWQNKNFTIFKTNFTANVVLAASSFLGMLFYELFIQKYFAYAVVDINDIYASLLASVIGFFIIQKIDNL